MESQADTAAHEMSRYLIFITVSLGLLLTGIAGTSVAVALESIRESFGISVVLAGWVIAIFQLTLTASMPIVGKISDVLGRRRTFMACLALYIVGSVMAALSPNIWLLIGSRLIQALGGGGFLPSAVGIVAEVFPQSRQRAIGFFSSIFPVGQIVGPVVGGWLINSFGWTAIFWVNVPTGLLVLVLSWMLLPRVPRREGHIDLIGAVLIAGTLSTLMGALSLIAYADTMAMWALVSALFTSTVVLTLVFVRHETTATSPIVEFEILRLKPFLAANIYNFIYGAGVIGIMSLIPLFAINVYGVSLFESGLILVPRAVGVMATSLIVSILLVRLGYRWPIVIGTCLAALSLIALSLEPQQLTALGRGLDNSTTLALILLIMGIGVGLAAPASNNACIELMPDRAATITGIRGMFRQAGGAVSITVATLTLHESASIAAGFQLVFIALAIAMLATIPAILAMPRSPTSIIAAVTSEPPKRQ
jgi:EmrB/QacA subfamily drug resistance transporter